MDLMVVTLICLGLGVVLFVVEMFTPGLGILGLLGAVAFFAAILLQIHNPVGILFMIALVFFLITVGMLIFFRLAVKGRFDKIKIVLNDQVDGASTNIHQETATMAGTQGVTLTPLRPAGKAQFGEKTLDVVTGGEFLPKGANVQIAHVEGLRIVVQAFTEEG